ncbi:hypothetical protein BGZ99_006538 [Dissophora globulifera]|uniref:Yeast cell wall synthesis Kre9/Knh1-like N-terminal domain-containing protein n=1 Tax=Dissophora globulifera TaxID=979702 RepID=A0A9P6URV1_9FUNG|nr:hypothetical protein BGZ99_006538 [Dissophora globulifera]
MKITSLSAVFCLAAAATAANVNRPTYNHPYSSSLERRDAPNAVDRRENKKGHDEHHVEAHKDGQRKGGKVANVDKEAKDDDEDNDKEEKDSDDKGEDKKDVKEGKDGKDAAENKNGGKAPANGNNESTVPRDYASPLWLVQPFGASIWEQGRAYVITWGPNPDPVYAKNIEPKSAVDITLMQGPPATLHEVTVLKKDVDESLHSFKWTVPTSVAPAKDYTIRITQAGKLETYSHYFEVVKAGDPRSTKSNVGEPILLPQKGDMPQPLNKGKTAPPPNPFPEDNKPDVSSKPGSAPPPDAKPVTHASSASETRSANILAFALTLFGAVYLL